MGSPDPAPPGRSGLRPEAYPVGQSYQFRNAFPSRGAKDTDRPGWVGNRPLAATVAAGLRRLGIADDRYNRAMLNDAGSFDSGDTAACVFADVLDGIGRRGPHIRAWTPPRALAPTPCSRRWTDGRGEGRTGRRTGWLLDG